MGQCFSSLGGGGVTPRSDRFQAAWQPALGPDGAAGFAAGPPPAPAYTTTANVGLGRDTERRVFLHDPAPGALQLPRIEEDQALQGAESPVKTQLSAAAAAAESTATGPVNWTRGELIGQGAFGSVYLGMDNDTGQLMAVKQVNIDKGAAERGKLAQHLQDLEAEVSLLQQLNHPNIVRYLGTERGEAALHIFLEYVPGGSIASLLAKFGSFRESVIKVYTKQILLGLEYLHRNGIMHRDIKGANILVDNTGLVKLADFGASKRIEDMLTMGSGCKSVKGTPYWMAPEVITQSGHGRQADIWSVACTVIEMATGKPPWSQFGSQVSAMFQIASSKGPPTIPESLSADCKDFLYLCFNRNWRDRPSASRLLQHPFLAEVVCRTVAAPLNNIANLAQEPAIKAWRAPKNVRVPSPMRADSEGVPFSTPSPMHPRLQEVAAGGARISLAMSSQGEGEQTPGGGELPLSPLGQNAAGGRREFGGAAQAPSGRHQRSPSKRAASLRASAPAFSGYASVALAQREPAAERPEAPLGSSTASTVHPRVAVGESQQAAGPPTRESSLGMEPALRASNSSLRLSHEASAAGAPAGPAPRQPSGLAGEGGGGAFDQPQLAAAQEAAQETPAPVKRDVNDLIEFSTGRGQAVRREASTPSTGDSHGTYKSDYNPMEEPSWMHPTESPLQASPAPPTGAGSPSKCAGAPQAGPGPARPSVAGPSAEPAQQQQQQQPEAVQPAQQEQQHMVWMDDDGSIDALPWDMGSWDSGPSGEPSPHGAQPDAQAGEPVGQDVLMTALNRRAQLEVRASLALFESSMSKLNRACDATPSPPKPPSAGPPAALAPVPMAGASLAAGPRLGAAHSSKEDLVAAAAAGAPGPMAQQALAAGAGGEAEKRRAAAGHYQAAGHAEDARPSFGGREAIWEQELSRELRQLPSQWRYQAPAGNRRMSMHGSPMKG